MSNSKVHSLPASRQCGYWKNSNANTPKGATSSMNWLASTSVTVFVTISF